VVKELFVKKQAEQGATDNKQEILSEEVGGDNWSEEEEKDEEWEGGRGAGKDIMKP
jgi:hypothetical protein